MPETLEEIEARLDALEEAAGAGAPDALGPIEVTINQEGVCFPIEGEVGLAEGDENDTELDQEHFWVRWFRESRLVESIRGYIDGFGRHVLAMKVQGAIENSSHVGEVRVYADDTNEESGVYVICGGPLGGAAWVLRYNPFTNRVESDFAPRSALQGKGYLITASAFEVPAAQAVGENGQVLTADSTAFTGLRWKTPSSGASGPAGGDLEGEYPNPLIKLLAVTTAKIANLAVTAAKLGAEAVETGKIKLEAVTTATIANLAVTAAKLAAEAVETAKIKAEAVTEGKIANLAVTAAKLGAEAVETAKIKAKAVTVAKISLLTGDNLEWFNGGEALSRLRGGIAGAAGTMNSVALGTFTAALEVVGGSTEPAAKVVATVGTQSATVLNAKNESTFLKLTGPLERRINFGSVAVAAAGEKEVEHGLKNAAGEGKEPLVVLLTALKNENANQLMHVKVKGAAKFTIRNQGAAEATAMWVAIG